MAVCPGLHIDDAEFRNKLSDEFSAASSLDLYKQELSEDGYYQLQEERLFEGLPFGPEQLAEGIRNLVAHGWSPTFIYLFDEVWMLGQHLRRFLQLSSGGNDFCFDFYAWLVDPKKAGRGWGPHRDRMGSDHRSFRADKTPMLTTCWIPLTRATPSNSCLYVVPAQCDPR